MIDAWLRRCGVGVGLPWCAAFASWCVENRAERKLGTIVEVAQAGALNLGRLFPATSTPQGGDLMFFPTDDKGAGHVGIVVGVSPEEALCIEGNSDNRVRIVRRLRSEVRFSSTRVETWDGPGSNADWAEPWRERWPLVRVEKAGTR
ncbi:MAG TPA: CHAP domain-containing protein [Polyangiaceae bacterium]